jgi:hypothetical protein
VRDRDLAAVGEAGFLRRAGLAVDDGDVVALLLQEPGGSGSDNACAQYDHFHLTLPVLHELAVVVRTFACMTMRTMQAL